MPKLASYKYYTGGQKYDSVEFLGKGQNEWKKLLPMVKTCDLIDFAFKSSEFRSFLRQNKTPLESLKWKFEQKSMGLRLEFPAFESVFIGYTPSNRSLQKGDDEPLDTSEIDFKIKNEDLEILQTRPVRSTSPFQVLKTITDVIMDIFIVKDTELSWDQPSTGGFLDLFVWDHSRHFKKIHFDSEDSEALKFLLEEVSTEILDIKTHNSTVQCSSPFESTILELHDYSDSFKMEENFLKMECKDVEMTVGRIASKELNALLKCWINGGLPNLEFLEVSLRVARGWRDYLFNEEEVFEGIQTVRSSRPLPPRPSYVLKSPRYIIPSIDYDWERNTFEIFRKSDNRKATVGMNPRTFGIAVWP
ncbi:hypothetical protein CAEBREN_25904 [Caenorhabditis brenneri]|uniref:Sdz-33 F-box domain-containing protein n=1 Tax=Caenorhabditis brenneri TaxID=135651 RepID=G0NTQ0_CAEBE|nr:hypothetical protein CAEBREN_25904 [Caenorhabditis brenneri]